MQTREDGSTNFLQLPLIFMWFNQTYRHRLPLYLYPACFISLLLHINIWFLLLLSCSTPIFSAIPPSRALQQRHQWELEHVIPYSTCSYKHAHNQERFLSAAVILEKQTGSFPSCSPPQIYERKLQHRFNIKVFQLILCQLQTSVHAALNWNWLKRANWRRHVTDYFSESCAADC